MIKQLIEWGLSSTMANDRILSRSGSRRLVLAYHNIIPSGSRRCGDASLHLPFDDFCKQLDVLSSNFDFVPLSQPFVAAPTGENRGQIVVTFDDAYTGALEFGVPELVRRGVPATIFVAPMLLDGAQFWWDRLADPTTGELDESFREMALTDLRGEGQVIVDAARSRGMAVRDMPQSHRGAGLPLLDHAMSLSGITAGAHSWSHMNLEFADGARLQEELQATQDWLRHRYASRYIPALAFPYGRFKHATELEARAAGYELTLRVEGGWIGESDSYVQRSMPRLNVPAGLSVRGFRLRLASWWPS
jgi:peptidoglycan/xylan/chitin deacetylase (PgdA/CDA1 family)